MHGGGARSVDVHSWVDAYNDAILGFLESRLR